MRSSACSIVAVGLFTLACRATTAQELADLKREIRARTDPAAYRELAATIALIAQVQRDGLPAAGLANKLREGLLKKQAAQAIATAVAVRADRLRAAAKLAATPGCAARDRQELSNLLLEAMERGASRQQLSELTARLTSAAGRSTTMLEKAQALADAAAERQNKAEPSMRGPLSADDVPTTADPTAPEDGEPVEAPSTEPAGTDPGRKAGEADAPAAPNADERARAAQRAARQLERTEDRTHRMEIKAEKQREKAQKRNRKAQEKAAKGDKK